MQYYARAEKLINIIAGYSFLINNDEDRWSKHRRVILTRLLEARSIENAKM